MQLTLNSSDRNNRGRSPGPSSHSASNRSLPSRHPSRSPPRLCTNHVRRRNHHLRVLRHASLLPHRGRDAEPAALRPLDADMPGHRLHRLPRHRRRRVHLLRLICCFASIRIRRPIDEKSVLRSRNSGPAGLRHNGIPRKSIHSHST